MREHEPAGERGLIVKSTRVRLFWTGSIFTLGIAVILLFQNCTQPPSSNGSTIDAAALNLDFAYDTVIDQIAYMSCSNLASGSFDTSAYFSFRAGAYNQGGIGLRSSFLTNTATAPAVRKATLLSTSPANTNTVLQLAIRDINAYQNIRTASGTQPILHEDYSNLFTPLGTLDVANAMVAMPANGRIKYYADGTVAGTRIEGDLSFASSYGLMNSIRQITSNTSYMTLTYSHAGAANSSGGETLALSPADVGSLNTGVDTNKSVYGRGFSLRYGQPSVSGLYAQFPQVALREVDEYSLETITDRSNVSTWSCPAQMQFRIVRMQDLAVAGANCLIKPDPPTLSNDLATVRNTLRFEDWYVDMDNHCIIPKKTGPDCYGSGATVIYPSGSACDSTNVATQCVAYTSICIRN